MFLNPVYEQPYSHATTTEDLIKCKINNKKWILVGGYHKN